MASRYWVRAVNGNYSDALGWASSSGGTPGASVPTTGDDAIFDANSLTNCTINSAVLADNLDASAYTKTLAGANTLGLSQGNLTFGAAMTLSYTGTITFTDTSGTTRNITMNGKTCGSSLVFNGVGGVWQHADAFAQASGKTVTVTAGTWKTNGKTITGRKILSTGTGVRTVDLSGSAITLTASGSPWDTSTATNLTLIVTTGTSITLDDSTATNKTFDSGALVFNDLTFGGSGSGTFFFLGTGVVARDVKVSNTGGATFQSVAMSVRDLDFTGYTGTWSASSSTVSVSRHLKMASGMTISQLSNVTMTGTGTLTCATKTLPFKCIINSSGTVTLGDAFASSAATAIETKLGNFSTGNFNMTLSGIFSGTPSGAGVRTIALGTSLITLTGVGTGWAMTTSPGSLTVTQSPTGEIRFTDSSASVKGFTGGGQMYGRITFGGTGSGLLSINDGNSCESLEWLGATSKTIFLATATHTFSLGGAGLVAQGTVAAPMILTGGSGASMTKPGNDVVCQGMAIDHISVGGGARWFAGRLSVDNGNNYGWRFTDLYRAA